MKKEILSGLIAIVAFAAIAIFVVNPSISTSVEIDGKRTSNENLYSPHNQKIDSFDPDEDTNHQVYYEAGFGSGLIDWLKDLFSNWLNEKIVDVNEAFPIGDVNPEDTNPDAVIEGIDKIVEDEKAGEPGSTPVVGAATGKYAGHKELIIDGKLREDEQNLFEAMGVRKIVYNEAERLDCSTGIRYVKSSHIAFLIGPDGQYYLYYHEELDPSSNKIRSIRISSLSPSGYPRIVASPNTNRCGVLKDKPTYMAGIDTLPDNLRYGIECGFSDDELGLECIIKGLSPEDVKRHIKEDEISLDTQGGTAHLKINDIPVIDGVEFQ